MNKVLLIKTCLDDELSHLNKPANQLVASIKSPSDTRVVICDLAKESLPHLTRLDIETWITPEAERTIQQKNLA